MASAMTCCSTTAKQRTSGHMMCETKAARIAHGSLTESKLHPWWHPWCTSYCNRITASILLIILLYCSIKHLCHQWR
jgi:hypothetical protein